MRQTKDCPPAPGFCPCLRHDRCLLFQPAPPRRIRPGAQGDAVRRSFEVRTYVPANAAAWQAPYARFQTLRGGG
jgi:hypothetical protein